MAKVYYSVSDVNHDAASPSILAVGDSWFFYPIPSAPAVNLLEALAPTVDGKSHTIFAVGNSGAEALDFIGTGKYVSAFHTAIRLYGSGLSSVWISAGGNDFAGFGDLRPLLQVNCAGATTASGCFVTGAAGLPGFFNKVESYYREIIGHLYTRTPKNCSVVMHAYDYAPPNGVGLFGLPGWLKGALIDAQVPLVLHDDCVRLIIDELHRRLKKIAKSDPDFLHVVDARGVLTASQWANELHPTGKGFQKIADVAWRPVLASLGLA